MKISLTMAVVAASLVVAGLAYAKGAADSRKAHWVYRETAVFNHVVGSTRFVGNFLAAPGRCDVTVFETRAEDIDLRQNLRHYVVPIAAGGQSILDAGQNASLSISCAPKADTIRVDAQTTPRAPAGSGQP